MFNELPESILVERSIIRRAELSGSILKRLPSFLDTLSKDTKTASSMAALEKELKMAKKEQDQNIAMSIEWVKEKIIKLHTSPFAKRQVVDHAIKMTEQALQNINNHPPALHLEYILANLQQAVSNLTAFENNTFFRGWAKTRNHSDYRTPEQENHILEKLFLPDCINNILSQKNSTGLHSWKERRESDAATLLDFLKDLSRYSADESTAETCELRLRCAQDAEELFRQGEPRPYLRKFSSTNTEDHPLSREQILCLIDTFLDMLERRIAQKKDTPPRKVNTASINDPRVVDKKTAVEWMKIEWLNDKETCRDMIVGKLIRVIDNGTVKLSKKYERSTYNNWARDADPHPLEKRLLRPKTKNR